MIEIIKKGFDKHTSKSNMVGFFDIVFICFT